MTAAPPAVFGLADEFRCKKIRRDTECAPAVQASNQSGVFLIKIYLHTLLSSQIVCSINKNTLDTLDGLDVLRLLWKLSDHSDAYNDPSTKPLGGLSDFAQIHLLA